MIVLKVGGSVLFPQGPDKENIRKLAAFVGKTKEQCALVVGGGKFNAIYADAIRSLGATEAFNDLVGIHFSRINARIIANAVGGQFLEELEDVPNVRLPVLGGMVPGQSTDAVAAVVAELTRGRLILVKDVGGIYSDNPKRNPKAKFIPSMTFDELLSFAKGEEFAARAYGVVDLQAARIIVRSKIQTIVCGIDDLDLAKKGKKGTIIS